MAAGISSPDIGPADEAIIGCAGNHAQAIAITWLIAERHSHL